MAVSRTSAFNSKSLQISVAGIGQVLLEKSLKAKRISIKLQPLKGVRVIVPAQGSFEEAQRFLHTKLDWVKEHLPQIEKQENNVTIYDGRTPFRTFNHELCLIAHQEDQLKGKITKGQLQVFYPAHSDVQAANIQTYIRKAIAETYRLEAKQYLPQRVHYFAQKFGFNYNKVFIKKASTRWGRSGVE